MKLKPRLYRGPEDFRHLDAILASGGCPGIHPYFIHPGELRWWQFYTFPEEERWRTLYLWEDESGRMAAWTLFTVIDGAFDVFCLPEIHRSPELKRLLAWSAEQMFEICRSDGQSRVYKWWNHPEDSRLITALNELGFVPAENRTLAFTRSLDQAILPAYTPPGFTLRSARGLAELENRAAVQHSAFESEIPLARYIQRFRSFLSSPAYEADQDIVVEAPDGSLAAFAKIWIDPVTRMGQFEPVGTHAGYQRRGLGRAVLDEGLRRMQTCGMTIARVCTGEANKPAVSLYENAGFHTAARLQAYVRDI